VDLGAYGHFDSSNPFSVVTAALAAVFLLVSIFPKSRAIVFGYVDAAVNFIKGFFYDAGPSVPPVPQPSPAELAAIVAAAVVKEMKKEPTP
jgi:hypothetical protein